MREKNHKISHCVKISRPVSEMAQEDFTRQWPIRFDSFNGRGTADNPPKQMQRTLTLTEQAMAKLDRQIEVAKRDGSGGTRGVKVSVDKNGKPRFQLEDKRISYENAIQHVAAQLDREQTPQSICRTNFQWDRLNGNTQAFFQQICEDMLTATKDAGLTVAVRLGHDIPKVGPQNQPRLTNLKKANLLESVVGEKKSHKMLRLTDAGRAQAAALGLIG
jgi:hypothetical protein